MGFGFGFGSGNSSDKDLGFSANRLPTAIEVSQAESLVSILSRCRYAASRMSL